MQIKINSLNLQNFQGIGKMNISFDDKATVISGRNGSGKSTIANAISWLLFDCAADKTKNYSPKTIGPDGKELHNLHHSAEAVFSCDTDEFSLKKDFYEEYVVRRGIIDADGNKKREFTGHICDYYVNGRQVKKEEYDNFLSSMFSPEDAKILTLPFYFATEMDTKTRREKIMALIGDVTDEDILEKDQSLDTIIRKIQAKGNADNLAHDLKEEAKQTNDKIKELPIRIEECNGNIIPPAKTKEEAEKSTRTLNAKIAELESRKTEMSDSAALLTLKTKALELKTRIKEIESDINGKNNEILSAQRKEKEEYEFTLNRLENDSVLLAQNLRAVENDLQTFTKKKKDLAEYIEKAKERTFNVPMPSDTCSCCGQKLPLDVIEKARANWLKAKEQFEEEKSKALSEANSRINSMYSDKKLAELTTAKEDIDSDIRDNEKQRENVKASLNMLMAAKPALISAEDNPEYVSLKEELDKIKTAMEGEDNVRNEAKNAIDNEIRSLKAKLDEENQTLNLIFSNEKLSKRIKELTAEHDESLKKAERIKTDIENLELYRRMKAELFEEKQISKFHNVYFAFFTEQINGGQKEVCEPFIINRKGQRISFYKASTGEKINGGLAIINAFSHYMNLSLPIIIDNAEAVNRIIQTEGQQILMKVTDAPLEISQAN